MQPVKLWAWGPTTGMLIALADADTAAKTQHWGFQAPWVRITWQVKTPLLVWEDPTCNGVAKPGSLNFCAPCTWSLCLQ